MLNFCKFSQYRIEPVRLQTQLIFDKHFKHFDLCLAKFTMNLSLVSVVCLLGTLQVNAIIEVPNSVVSASSPSFNWAVFLSAQRPLETFKVLMKTELEIIPDWEKVYWFRTSHGTNEGEFVFFMVLHQN